VATPPLARSLDVATVQATPPALIAAITSAADAKVLVAALEGGVLAADVVVLVAVVLLDEQAASRSKANARGFTSKP
jgi:hypothetical protein